MGAFRVLRMLEQTSSTTRVALRNVLYGLLTIVCTAALALAGGAVWLTVVLYAPSAEWWFALPLGVLLGFATRAWITHGRLSAVCLAMGATALAAVYMQCLYVGWQVSLVMGLPYLDTLYRAGAGMLLALARAHLNAHLMLAVGFGMALSLVTVLWKHRRTT